MESLTRYDAMRTALVEAHRIDEVKDIRDKAEALRLYAKQAGEGLDSQNKLAEIKIRAERRCGELLGEMDRADVGRPEKTSHAVTIVSPPTLSDMGITRMQSSRWQAMASMPEEVFESHIAEVVNATEGIVELTSAGLLRVAQQIKREQRNEEMRLAVPLPGDKYRVWYADPPWSYGNSGVINDSDSYGRAARHYPSMSIDALCDMGSDIRSKCEPDAVLFMWVTSPLLAECFPVIDAWGFQYKSSFVWDKVGHNFGHYNSVRHEFLLVATRGSCLPDDRTLHDSVLSIPKSDVHSQKPEEFRRMIDSLYTWGRRIELFARQSVEGWDTWGNQA